MCGTLPAERPVFIADLHLSRDEPALTEALVDFLENVAPDYGELFVLGDCFDAWIGDDEIDRWPELITAFNRLHATGTRIYFMQGNRDFIMGRDAPRTLGGTLIADPTVIVHNKRRILLSHGDAWCTGDEDYQKVRRRVRRAWWQGMMLSLPRFVRLKVARDARAKSKAAKKNKAKSAPSVMDVAVPAVAEAVERHDADLVVHGHTHRPTLHPPGEGLPVTRIVVPDWRVMPDGRVSAGYVHIDRVPVLETFTHVPAAKTAANAASIDKADEKTTPSSGTQAASPTATTREVVA